LKAFIFDCMRDIEVLMAQKTEAIKVLEEIEKNEKAH